MAAELLGLFNHADQALKAAGALRDSGFQQVSLMSPTPLEGAERVLGGRTPVIRRFTFFGMLTGLLAGFVLAAGTASLYPLPTGGRPIIPFPPYLVISYEVGILFGVLATLLGFLISARLPAWKARHYAPETQVDRFGVLLSCRTDQEAEQARTIILAAGASEIRAQEATDKAVGKVSHER